jgi:DNA-binding MarR family transcriptional regulator
MSTDFSNLNSSIDSLLGYQLRRVSSLAMAELAEALLPLELRITDVTVLYQIAENPAITSSEIGKALGIRRANMTPLIAGLMNKGYLNTKAKDGRSQALSLTRAGRKIYQQAQKIVDRHEQQFFLALPDNEKQQLSRLLIQIWKHHSAE